ncbi:Flp family type IVb pilin [Geminicoccus roseus]|uniref:Flp family type IVb pilin n=1 Tax=Geminicoccus roseus TaxID=404900 RepID=UPI0004227EF7|nr:Flp family type IVb pilin [Geminicoccus roseus]
MIKLLMGVKALWSDRRGVTAIEYAVMAGAVAVALVAIMGDSTTGVMGALSQKMTAIINAIPSGTSP